MEGLAELSLISLIALVVGGIIFLAFYLWTLVWVFRDTEKRGAPAILITILSVIFWPWVPLIWLVVRPKFTKSGSEV